MSIFKRIKQMTKATIFDRIERAEDPIVVMNEYIQQLAGEISTLESLIAKQRAHDIKWQQQLQLSKQEANKYLTKASEALDDGNEVAAKQYIAEKLVYEQREEELRRQIEETNEQLIHLRSKYTEIKSLHEKMVTERQALIVRAQTAKVTKKLNETLANTNEDSTERGLGKMREYVSKLEAEAVVSTDLRELNQTNTEKLEKVTNAKKVEEEFEKLKMSKTIK